MTKSELEDKVRTLTHLLERVSGEIEAYDNYDLTATEAFRGIREIVKESK
jgi:hypothetical protein